MRKISYLTTPRGEELAILPRGELEELLDANRHAKALSDYDSGRDPGLSAAEMRELVAAASPLAFWRRKRGMTQADLAHMAGVTQNYVSDLETRKREGSPALWVKIARSLNVPVEELIDE